MLNHSYYFLHLKRISFSIIILFSAIISTSCSKNEIEEEKTDPNAKEGVIKLYTNNEAITFSQIKERPVIKWSGEKMRYDTIGYSYIGYRAEISSNLGSIQINILNKNLELNYVEYRYPTPDMAAGTFAKWDNDIKNIKPMKSDIKEQNKIIRGVFSGNLYPSGKYHENVEPIVIDSCSFQIYK